MSQTKLLFTGESQYLVHEAIQYRKDNFFAKYGGSAIHSFSNQHVDVETIQSCVLGGGLFAQKSLTIIYGIPRDNTPNNKLTAGNAESIENLLMNNWEKIPDDNIVILVSYKPDKRTRSRKFFSTHALIKQFNPKKGKDLSLFVLSKCTKDGVCYISHGQAQEIIEIVGSNLYILHNECDKILHYCTYHKLEQIESKQLKEVLCNFADHDSFKILETIRSDTDKSLSLLEDAKRNQQNEYEFLGMLFRGLKVIVNIIDLDTQGVKTSKEIAKMTKSHPFATAKQYGKINLYRTRKDSIKKMYSSLLELDYGIKTGRYPIEGFWLKIKTLIQQQTTKI